MAAPSSATAPDGVLLGGNTVELVQQYYGETLATSADLKTSACCAAGALPLHIRDIVRRIPSPVTDKFYGCGAPLPLGMEGLRVLDLGWCDCRRWFLQPFSAVLTRRGAQRLGPRLLLGGSAGGRERQRDGRGHD